MNITKEQYEQAAINYKVGDTVLHKDFGFGEIFHIEGEMADIMFKGNHETQHLPLTDLVNEIGN
jgi:co-chaperonin GroES (HSP10)